MHVDQTFDLIRIHKKQKYKSCVSIYLCIATEPEKLEELSS